VIGWNACLTRKHVFHFTTPGGSARRLTNIVVVATHGGHLHGMAVLGVDITRRTARVWQNFGRIAECFRRAAKWPTRGRWRLPQGPAAIRAVAYPVGFVADCKIPPIRNRLLRASEFIKSVTNLPAP